MKETERYQHATQWTWKDSDLNRLCPRASWTLIKGLKGDEALYNWWAMKIFQFIWTLLVRWSCDIDHKIIKAGENNFTATTRFCSNHILQMHSTRSTISNRTWKTWNIAGGNWDKYMLLSRTDFCKLQTIVGNGMCQESLCMQCMYKKWDAKTSISSVKNDEQPHAGANRV